MEKKEKFSFEEGMKKLEYIVQELERGDLNLEDSMSKFEEGMNLSKECSKFLENAEKKVSILVQEEDGNIKEENF